MRRGRFENRKPVTLVRERNHSRCSRRRVSHCARTAACRPDCRFLWTSFGVSSGDQLSRTAPRTRHWTHCATTRSVTRRARATRSSPLSLEKIVSRLVSLLALSRLGTAPPPSPLPACRERNPREEIWPSLASLARSRLREKPPLRR